MGRWAQRRRTGGGPPPGAPEIQIDDAFLVTGNEILLVYSSDVTAGDFENGDFETSPDTFGPDTITQTSSNELTLFFSEDVTDQTHINYAGDVPNVTSPQTEEITIP